MTHLGEGNTKKMNTSHEILLVEDNSTDAMLLMSVFRKSQDDYHFTVAADGERASDYIHRRSPHSQRAIPQVIILDLNLPKKDGKQLLSEIRTNLELLKVPVLIVSGSNNPQDRKICLELGASRFLIKPSNLKALADICAVIKEFLGATTT